MSQAGIIDVEQNDPQIPTLFTADVGNAIPIANELEILASYVLQAGIPAETVGSGNSITTNIQLAGSALATDVTKAGLALFDSADFSVDANGFVSLSGAGSGQTITGDIGGALSPTLGNWNILGGAGITTTGVGSTLTIDVTGTSSFTTGSVIFWGGSSFAEDNPNFFWDNTNNRLGIGTNTPADNLVVVGAVDFIHTATESDDHALEIDVNAAGFNDVKAIDIVYVTGALAASEEDAVISINIDETLAVGGEIFGLEVLSTGISGAVKAGLKVGVGVGAISQSVGTFGDADSILNIAVNVTAALASGGVGGVSAFVADNDTMTIGDAAKFEEIEVILTTPASGSGIAPTFEYSTGIGTWAVFGPIDGTNGLRNTGNIAWQLDDIAGWMTGAGGLYLIRWTRTRNTLTTTPVLDEIQIAQATEFFWDKEGDVSINSLTLVTDLTVPNGGTGVSSLPQYSVVLGAGASPLSSVGPTATVGQILQSAGNAANPAFSTATYPATTTANRILYSSAANTVSEITSANNSILSTDGSGVPSFGTSLINNYSFTASSAGSSRVVTASHSDNTNTASNASFNASVGGTSGGDAWHQVTVGTARSYAFGVDTSDSQSLKMNTTNAATLTPSSGTNLWKMTSAGERTMPLQPAFSAYVTTAVTNATGDGTVVVVIAETEIFDQGSDYDNTTGTFTAPITGRYRFDCAGQISNIGAGHTSAVYQIAVSNHTVEVLRINPANARDVNNFMTVSGSVLVDMDAADTMVFRITVFSSTKTITIQGSAGTPMNTYITGELSV